MMAWFYGVVVATGIFLRTGNPRLWRQEKTSIRRRRPPKARGRLMLDWQPELWSLQMVVAGIGVLVTAIAAGTALGFMGEIHRGVAAVLGALLAWPVVDIVARRLRREGRPSR